MSTVTEATDLIDVYTLLDGEDDHTMGDPGQMGSTGRVRQALYELLEAAGIDPHEGGFAEGYVRNDRANAPVEVEFERLRELERAADDSRWTGALKEIENSDQPLTALTAAESRAVVSRAASALNRLNRSNILHDVARNLVLIPLLESLASEYASSPQSETLAEYAGLLRLQNQRIVMWNGLEIGIEAGPHYEYTGAIERYQDYKLLVADYERSIRENGLPYETTAGDWRLVSTAHSS